jgi:hypothetical protein
MPSINNPNKTPASAAKAMGCAIFFGLFWSAIVLLFDGVLGWGALRQIQANSFPTAPGRVTQSSITSQRGSKGRTTYLPTIKYSYRVDGKEYRGDRYRFGLWTGGYATARQIVDAFPVGRTINVFYSPSAPSNAVLKAGLEGNDLFLAMFTTPFNLIMLGIWFAGARILYRRAFPVPAGGAKVTDDGFTTRVRLSNTSPLLVGAVTLGVLSFLASFAVLIVSGTDPPLQTMNTAWITILILALLACIASWIKPNRTDKDLVIDEASRRVTLPATFGRLEPLSVPLDKALGIEVEQILTRGGKGQTYFRYAPIFIFSDHDGQQRREKLAEWNSQPNAAALAAWLRERLRLAPPREEVGGESS